MARSAQHPDAFNHVTDAAPEYVDVILWHRVVLAVAALALVVAGLGYGVFRLTTAEDSTTPALTAVALDELTQQQPPAAIPDTAAAVDQADPTDQSSDQNSAQTQDRLADQKPDQATHQPVGQTAGQTAAAAKPVSAAATSPVPALALANTTAATSTAAAAAKPAAHPQKTSTAVAADNRYQVHTTILVPAVKRAVLTDKMRGREPGSPVTDTRSLSEQPRFSLYQFVDIRGKAGDTLIYHWKRNGKTVAKVRIPVGSDKWRNHASKNFNQNLMGDWQVDVTNQNNMLLVRSEFRLGE